MAESESRQLSNVKMSSEVIVFSPETQTAELSLTNLHETYFMYFKIKTKIEKVFDVKPVLGCIKPGESINIYFKAASPINESQYANLEQNLLFLVQVVNSQRVEMSREEQNAFWKEIKTNKSHIELGYLAQKLNIKFSNEAHPEKQYVPLFNVFQSKVNNKFSSNVKSESGKSSSVPMPVSHNKRFSFGQSEIKEDKSANDAQLSRKFQDLKIKEEKLVRQRENIFQQPSGMSGSKKKSSNIIVIVLFLMAFLLGNFLQTLLAQTKASPQPVEKGFFQSLF